jgi:hypothetical protein
MDGSTELRLVGVSEDGHRLVLAEPDGIERTVEIDDRLRAAVNGHLSRLGQLTMALESRISPKEIQSRVRAGESAEHVALTAGVPLERVLRFVGPVLREREHVADQARRARLIIAGRTTAQGPASLLGDLVDRVCSRRGVDPADVSWDSARRDDHSWLITVSWPDGANACWSLDPLRHQVSPLDATSRRISGLPATDPDDAAERDLDSDPFDEPVVASRPANVREFGRRPQLSLETPLVELPFDDADPAGEDDTASVDTDDDVPAAEAAAELPAHDDRPGGRPAARSSKRASVPNWDDIVFGMKPKE